MTRPKKYHWFLISPSVESINWQANNMYALSVNGKTITLVKNDNQIFAVAHKCPHAGGIMADGYLDSLGNIVCPLHRYKFNLINGRNTSGEGYYLKTYLVEQRQDGIYVGFEENGFLGIF